jgi:hypothetical protein
MGLLVERAVRAGVGRLVLGRGEVAGIRRVVRLAGLLPWKPVLAR